ncbi:hypothetical protein [Pseudothauera lacus]|uniref:Uncharacterized protein n=1 Tax=Pseudothauera lacus TaxID=2136175 RepID=A0A2T4ICV4_9RHOO|nr:hypothetical protein [Pseudothauera lacus]PTD95593.1 hypothetical protein C8261_14175 [Pseudothauera lacus]
MSRRQAPQRVAVDAALLRRVELEAPALLRRHGRQWAHAAQAAAVEHGLVAVLSLAGLFVLGWPPASMALFLICALWLGLLFDALRLALAPGLVAEGEVLAGREAWLWPALDAMQRGQDSCLQHQGGRMPPLLQLLCGLWFALWLSWAVLDELARSDGVGVFAGMAARPDMLGVMVLGVLGQLVAGLFALRRELHAAECGDAPLRFQPIVEVVLWFLMLLLWFAATPITMLAALLVGAGGDGIPATLIFVASGYALMLLRALAEWGALRRQQRQLAWLRERLEARGITA